MKRIIGCFHKRIYVTPDTLVSLEIQPFDATRDILQMDLEHILKLEDAEDAEGMEQTPGTSIANIGRRHVSHEGPFAVFITQAICQFFNISQLKDLKPKQLQDACADWDRVPRKAYVVTIQRTSYADVEHTVYARDESEARLVGLEESANIDFIGREHHADYEVTNLVAKEDTGQITHF